MPIVNDDGVFESAIEAAAVDWSKLNQPTGEAKLMDMGESPVVRQIEDFKVQASKPPIKTLSEGSDEATKTAMDVVMSFGAGTMAGVKARTTKAKLADLGYAQVLEQAGEHPDVIWKNTGFARGAEGRWRHEIDDSKAVFTEPWSKALDETLAESKQFGLQAPLSSVLKHPELFEAYPDLAKLKVVVDKKYADPEGAVFQVEQGRVVLGPKAAKDPGVLMHEVQHWIQEYEGFAKGGSPAKVGDPHKDYAAWENYRRLAGEVEAHNTEARLLLNEKERRGMAPWWSEDVKRRDQIVVKEASRATHEGVYDPVLKRMMKREDKPANDNQLGSAFDDVLDHNLSIDKRIGEVAEKTFDILSKPVSQRTEFETARLKVLEKQRQELIKSYLKP